MEESQDTLMQCVMETNQRLQFEGTWVISAEQQMRMRSLGSDAARL